MGFATGARKLRDRGAESRAGEGSGRASSMGETLPGDKIRRGSIRATMRELDLEL